MAHGRGSFPHGRDGVGRDRQWTAARGGSFCATMLLAIGSGRRRVGREFLRDGVGRDRQRIAARGGPMLVIESLATSIGGQRHVEGRGVSIVIDGAYMAQRKVRIVWGDWETRAIGLLPSCPRLGNYAKFALSFAKLSKIQTPNTKPLDSSFCDFWQTTKIQTSNVKSLEILLSIFNTSYMSQYLM